MILAFLNIRALPVKPVCLYDFSLSEPR